MVRNKSKAGLGAGKSMIALSSPEAGVGARYHTPDLTEMKVCWKMPLRVQWKVYIYIYIYIYIYLYIYIYIHIVPVEIHWTSDNPLESTTEK